MKESLALETLEVDTTPTPVVADVFAPGAVYLVVQNLGANPANADVACNERGGPGYTVMPDDRIQADGYPIEPGEVRRVDVPANRASLLRVRAWSTTGLTTVRVEVRQVLPHLPTR